MLKNRLLRDLPEPSQQAYGGRLHATWKIIKELAANSVLVQLDSPTYRMVVARIMEEGHYMFHDYVSP
jgi:hypothetical protein